MANNPKRAYAKPWLDLDGQVKKLVDRGLAIPDKESAKRFLAYVNYYRFTGFCLRFQSIDAKTGDRIFNKGVSFEDVRRLCLIDRDLRDCFSEALEMVEISLRACIAYHFAQRFGAFGHLNPNNFAKDFSRERPSIRSKRQMVVPFDEWHKSMVDETRRSREIFVKHFEQTYSQYPDMPIWTAAELCSFGTLSKMYWYMLTREQSVIAKEYDVPFFVLDSWLHALTFLRNVCAHHGRLWDKTLNVTPKLPLGKNWQKLSARPRTVYVSALMLNWMLAHDSIDPAQHKEWKCKIENVLNRIEREFPSLMHFTGFPADWKKNPLWWQV